LLASQIPAWWLWWKLLDRVQLSDDAIVCDRHGRLAYADIVTATDGLTLELVLRDGRALRIRARMRGYMFLREIDDYSFKLFRKRFAYAYAYAAWRLEHAS
jgi:hypothetical protein